MMARLTVATLLLVNVCVASAASTTNAPRSTTKRAGKGGPDLAKEAQKVQSMEALALKDESIAMKDAKNSRRDENLAESEEKIADAREDKAMAEETVVERDERKVENEFEAGDKKAALSDEIKVRIEERGAEKDETAAKKEERMAESDEKKSRQELKMAQKDEKIAEKDETAAEKVEKKAEKDGVDVSSLHKAMKGELTVIEEEMITRQQIYGNKMAEQTEQKAQQMERKAEKEEDQAEKQEDKVEREDMAGKYKLGEKQELVAESAERGADLDQVKAKTVANKVAARKADAGPNALSKLYDMEGATIPKVARSLAPSTGLFITGMFSVGMAVVGFRTFLQSGRGRRQRDFMPVEDDEETARLFDGYDSEGPAE